MTVLGKTREIPVDWVDQLMCPMIRGHDWPELRMVFQHTSEASKTPCCWKKEKGKAEAMIMIVKRGKKSKK